MIYLIQLQIIIIALLVTIACVIPGNFLVLRGVALMSDAISHAILPGIVIMFLCVGTLNSPLLIIGASLAGLLTVITTEALMQTQCIKKDTALGLVYPFFFSIGVLLISACARNVHLDTDMVLLGELAFAPFNRLICFGYDIGPVALWTMIIIIISNASCAWLFYKELIISTFDPILAHMQHIRPSYLYYGLMMLTAITTVAAFDAVGSIVVVALMICPPAIAYVLCNSIHQMIWLSLSIGCYATLIGYIGAWYADVSIAGSIATAQGLVLFIVILLAPQQGIIARMRINQKLRTQHALDCIVLYLQEQPFKKVNIAYLSHQLRWSKNHALTIIAHGVTQGKLMSDNDTLYLPN